MSTEVCHGKTRKVFRGVQARSGGDDACTGVRSSIAAPTSALGCGFNRSLQHLISNYREEDVEYGQSR